MIEILIIGFAIAFNFIILRYKYTKQRYNDLAMDVIVIVILAILFGGTILGLAAAAVGGVLVSIYLLFSKPVGTPSDSNKPNLKSSQRGNTSNFPRKTTNYTKPKW